MGQKEYVSAAKLIDMPSVENLFPHLKNSGFEITSPATPYYNCIAWAAEDTSAWWWPDAMNQCFWPSNVPREESKDAFVKAFETLRYKVCDDSSYEEGYEKIAIYLANGEPQHAARQLDSGKWTSKLGRDHDIEHGDLKGVSGKIYGKDLVVMKRSKIRLVKT